MDCQAAKPGGRCGEKGGDCTSQLADEVKALSKAERESLLREAQLPLLIPTDHALAMKADLALPWNKLRVLRR